MPLTPVPDFTPPTDMYVVTFIDTLNPALGGARRSAGAFTTEEGALPMFRHLIDIGRTGVEMHTDFLWQSFDDWEKDPDFH